MSVWGTLLDKSLVFNFDRHGFTRHSKSFKSADVDVDLSNRHWVVTGANSGIGFDTTKALAQRGAHVSMVCRSMERAQNAVDAIRRERPHALLSIHRADMSLLRDVNTLCDALEGPIHGIVHNAGNMLDTFTMTDEGHEVITALHILGPTLMTQRLHEKLVAGASTAPARVVFVSSGGMYTQKLDENALNPNPEDYDGTVHYARTKRGQVVLARRMHQEYTQFGIAVHSMHPGWADTPAVRRAMPKFYRLTRRILRSPAQAADTVIWLACCPSEDIEQHGFWFDRKRVPTHMLKKTRHTDSDEELFLNSIAQRLKESSDVLHTDSASVK